MSFKKSSDRTPAIWNQIEGHDLVVSNKGMLRLEVGKTKSLLPVFIYVNLDQIEGLRAALTKITPDLIEKAQAAMEEGQRKEQKEKDKSYVNDKVADAQRQAQLYVQAAIDAALAAKKVG